MTDGTLTFLRPHDGTGRLVFGDVGDAVAAPSVRVFDGTAWVTATAKRWNGSAWVAATVKRFDGTAWQNT